MNPVNYRLIVFLSAFLIFGLLEFFMSYRKRELSRLKRWPGNILIVVLDSVLVKLAFPLGAAGIAVYAADNSLGLFNLVEVNQVFRIVVSIILLDLAIYVQHVLSHKLDWFWRLHRVHHSDPDLDVTSALRFHPLEIAVSMLYKMVLIIVLGIDPFSVLLFEMILNAMAMFNHSNIPLPKAFEKILRLFVVTPQMHIIHHSIYRYESDSNYGFNLSLWDRFFATYTDEWKSEGKIGYEGLLSAKDQQIHRLIAQPFTQK